MDFWVNLSLTFHSVLPTYPWLLVVWKFIKVVAHLVDSSCEVHRLCQGLRQRQKQSMLTKAIECSLQWSTELELERKALLEQDVNVKDVFERICLRKKLVPSSLLYQETLLPSLHRIVAVRQISSDLEGLAKTVYDSKNTEHEHVLGELWTLLRPEEPLTARVSKQWQDIGFQGDDPATDFRGMGYLGLASLKHFAQHYPDQARSILLLSQHPTRWFPFAITGIQISQRVLKLVDSGQVNTVWYDNSEIDARVYFELVSFALILFGKAWQQSDATIVDFPIMFSKYEADLQDQLRNSYCLPQMPTSIPL